MGLVLEYWNFVCLPSLRFYLQFTEVAYNVFSSKFQCLNFQELDFPSQLKDQIDNIFFRPPVWRRVEKKKFMIRWEDVKFVETNKWCLSLECFSESSVRTTLHRRWLLSVIAHWGSKANDSLPNFPKRLLKL